MHFWKVHFWVSLLHVVPAPLVAWFFCWKKNVPCGCHISWFLNCPPLFQRCTNLSRNQRLCSEVLSDSGVLYEALQFVLQIRCVFIEGYPFPCPCLGPKNVLNTTTQPGTSHFLPEGVVSAWVPACLSGISQGGAGPAGVCSHSSGGEDVRSAYITHFASSTFFSSLAKQRTPRLFCVYLAHIWWVFEIFAPHILPVPAYFRHIFCKCSACFPHLVEAVLNFFQPF